MELELRTDAKEVAEHTMLVDLARNDLARVAVPGRITSPLRSRTPKPATLRASQLTAFSG